MKTTKMSIFLIFVIFTLVFSACASNESVKETQGEIYEGSQEHLSAVEKKVIIGYADYPTYISLNDLAEKSDYIIFGTVLSKKHEWMSLRIENKSDDEYLNPGGDVDNDLTLVTIFEVEVKNNYKTTASIGDVIKVLMIGGETEDVIYKIDGSPDIKNDEEYIFFLSKSSIVENGAWLLNDTQSLYFTDGDTISSVTKDGFELSFDILDKLME